MASALLQMEVHASEVRLRWKDGLEGDKARFRQSQEMVQQANYANSGTGRGDASPTPALLRSRTILLSSGFSKHKPLSSNALQRLV
jgi:hypothetical protein